MNGILIDWFEEELNNSEQLPLLFPHFNTLFYLSLAMFTGIVGAVAFYSLAIVFGLALQFLQQKETIVYDLRAPLQVPYWDIKSGGIPFFIEACHMGSVEYIIILAYGVDLLFVYYMIIISGLYNLLKHKLSLLSDNNKTKLEMRKLVINHQVLMSCRVHLNKAFGAIFIGLCVTSAASMCTIAYQFYQVPKSMSHQFY